MEVKEEEVKVEAKEEEDKGRTWQGLERLSTVCNKLPAESPYSWARERNISMYSSVIEK